jgi:hypothetical protein
LPSNYVSFSTTTKKLNIYNLSDFWIQPKMSGILQNNVQDPRSQDPNFLGLFPLQLKLKPNGGPSEEDSLKVIRSLITYPKNHKYIQLVNGFSLKSIPEKILTSLLWDTGSCDGLVVYWFFGQTKFLLARIGHEVFNIHGSFGHVY